MKTIGCAFFAGMSIFWLAFCSLSPSMNTAAFMGFTFPLEEEARLEYDGEMNRALQALGGKVYFSTNKGKIYAVDAAARTIDWQFVADAQVAMLPSVSQDKLIFADKENTIYCLALDSKVRWRKKIDEKITGEIAQNDGKILFVTEGTNLVTLNAADGTEAWRFRAGGAIRTMPVFWSQRIIFGTAEGKLYFLLPSGRLDAVFEAGAAVAGPLFIDLNRLYFSLEDGTFHCLELASRKRRWKIKAGSFLASQPAVDEKRVFFVVSNNMLFCLDKKGGDLVWWQSLSSRAPFSPVVCGDQIFIATLPNLLVAYKKKTGEYTGGFNAGEELKAATLRHDTHLLISIYNAETFKGSLVFLKGQEPKKDSEKK